MITPADFVKRWGESQLREQQAAQSHFNELCELVGHKTPTQLDPEGTFFTFEEQVRKATGGKGRADVWYKGHFAWEYKGKHKDLDAAYAQLLAYRGDLGNPPLLVVCDFLEYRIYPQWPNTSGLPFIFRNEDLLDPKTLRFITWLLEDPQKFLDLRQAERERREKLTLSLAEKFAHLADLMRNHRPSPPTLLPHGEGSQADQAPWQPLQIARFLTKLVFALFAEDVEIMPKPFDQTVFRYLLMVTEEMPETFAREMGDLFQAMDGQRYGFVGKFTPYFNGGMFADSAPGAGDGYEVLDLTLIPGAIDLLREVSEADWRFVNPTIFGTLFEGALDVSKRAQLGAHYTGEDDIRLVVEPVLMQPLYRLWEEIRAEAEATLQAFLEATLPKARQQTHDKLTGLYERMMTALESTRVLDPACGSGNFLYMSLRAMKDLEARVRKFFEPLGLPFRDVVMPRQLYGIEKDEFAANLAKVVVWIGYLQWRYEDEGVLHPHNPRKQPHPRELPYPIIKDKNSPDEPDRIICDDAIMRYDAAGKPYEPDWPEVDVIIGNPPFLGDKRMRSELGDKYVDEVRELYEGRVPGGADLVTYWYEKSRDLIEKRKASDESTRAGLLATQSIRAGANRTVLERIKQTGDIFMAWSDRPWVLQGASVRISIVGFDDGTQQEYLLDGVPVTELNSDLQNTIDATKAKQLLENSGLAFIGTQKGGDFDIPNELAQKMIADDPISRDVVCPWINADDITARPKEKWIINFRDMNIEEAQKYAAPFNYVLENIKPKRDKSRDNASREYWWQLQRSRPALREAVKSFQHYIATPRVAKHRLFTWASIEIVPDSRIVAIAQQDDYFFGVLHSTIHERWSLRLASWHGVGNDPTYNAQSCFETFPFPWRPGEEDPKSEVYQAISAGAKQLHEEREAWLNPPPEKYIELGITEKTLKERTLTNAYNAVVAWREALTPSQPHSRPQAGEEKKPSNGNGNGNGKIPKAARDFAPRLAELHDALDKAVLAAYGWDDLFSRLRTTEGDEELLRRLLALNLQRAEG